MDLIKYFTENYKTCNNKFYIDFYVSYEMIISDFDFILRSESEILEEWKKCLDPNVVDIKENIHNTVIFGVTSFWLYCNNYIIEQYPIFLKEWQKPSELTLRDLKIDTANLYGYNGQANGVAWNDRRKYIKDLSIIKKNNSHLPVSSDIESILHSVSSSNTEFQNMSLNEKLRTIRDSMENIAKVDGKYVEIPYDEITLGMISKIEVKEFSSLLQNFRHGDKDMIRKRDSLSNSQKLFMVDFGLLLINLSYVYLTKNEDSHDY